MAHGARGGARRSGVAQGRGAERRRHPPRGADDWAPGLGLHRALPVRRAPPRDRAPRSPRADGARRGEGVAERLLPRHGRPGALALLEGRKAAMETATSTALVRVDAMRDMVEDEMGKLGLKTRKNGRMKRPGASQDGWEDGADLDLSDT